MTINSRKRRRGGFRYGKLSSKGRSPKTAGDEVVETRSRKFSKRSKRSLRSSKRSKKSKRYPRSRSSKGYSRK